MQNQNLWEYLGIPMWLICSIEVACILVAAGLLYYGYTRILNSPVGPKKEKEGSKEKENSDEKTGEKEEGSIEDFRAIMEKNEIEDAEKYGPKTDFSKFNYTKFIEFISSLGECKAEILKASAGIGIGWIGFKQEVKQFSSNKDILPFLERILSGELSIPFGPKVFADFPFLIEYREQKGKKYAHLHTDLLGTPNSPLTQYSLFVREV